MTHTRTLPIIGILLLTAPALPAQQTDPRFGQLVPYGKLQAKLDDRTLDEAEIYVSERAGVYLVLAPNLDDPLLIDVRNRQVERVSASKVEKSDDGTAHLQTEAVLGTVGPFEVSGTQLTAALADGRRLTLEPKPPLLGLKSAEDLTTHDPSYAYLARQYPPNEKTIAALRQETRNVKVRVYFGSWCQTCSRMVPWVLEVAKALEGSRIRFEYYGLPQKMDDPVALEADVHGVPTMVVSVDGEELGRASAPDLGVPEKVLMKILGSS